MIEWYKDDEIGIFFNKVPKCEIRYPVPYMHLDEIKDIENYPFINNQDLEVFLFDYKNFESYYFKIPKNYKWDGASIPRLFWRVVGAKTDPRFLVPSMVHDRLCENHNFVKCNRYFATKIFERLLYVSGVSNFKRWMMFHSVDNFQKLCGWHV